MNPGLFNSVPTAQAPLPQDTTADALWVACATAVAASLTLAATMSWAAGVPAAAGVKGFLMVVFHRLSDGVLFPASAPPWFALYTPTTLSAIAVGAAVAAFLGWTLAFKKVDPAKHVRGKQLAEGKGEIRHLLHAEVKREGEGIFLAPGLLAGAERVRRSFFLLGSIGGGKTQALLYLLNQLINQDYKLLIVDGPKGDMSRTIPDAVVIAPWHDGPAWDIARDCSTRGYARELARRLIPVSEKDPLWGNAAGMIFVSILCKLQAENGENWGWADIFFHVMLPIDQLKKIAEIHYPPAVQAIADAESKTTQSIMINLTAFMADVMEMALAWRHTREKFSFLDWWQNEDHAQKNVIIQTSGEYSALGQAYISAIVGLLSNLTVSPSFPESKTRKNVVVIDEFAQLPKMAGFEKFLEIGRSKGVSAIIATQSPGQIKKVWGAEDLQAWFGMVGTRYFARVLGHEDQKFVLDELGQQDILIPSETITSTGGGCYSRSVAYSGERDH